MTKYSSKYVIKKLKINNIEYEYKTGIVFWSPGGSKGYENNPKRGKRNR